MSQGAHSLTTGGVVAGSSFYGMLTAEERARLPDERTARVYRPGYVLMIENQPSLHVVVLLAGWAKATSATAGREEIVLRIYGPGDLFGCEAALTGQPRSETVTALTRCKALVLPARWFTELIATESGVARAFSLAMLKRANSAEEQIKLRSAPCDVRLAHTLIELADRAGAETPYGITIPVGLPQQDLASLIGASRSTVARMLHALRERDLIRTSYRSIVITDPGRLRKAAGGRS